MEYNFIDIEKKWQQKWVENKTYKVVEDENKQKFYVLNMFPYPSGAGLHVGHPEGYTATDILSRYKKSEWGTMYFTQWDGMHLDYLLSNMR